jgi:hypothetical protein
MSALNNLQSQLTIEKLMRAKAIMNSTPDPKFTPSVIHYLKRHASIKKH